MSIFWHLCLTVKALVIFLPWVQFVMTSAYHCLHFNVSLSLHECVSSLKEYVTNLTLICHWLDINVSLSWQQYVTLLTSIHQCVTDLTSMCHCLYPMYYWLYINVTLSWYGCVTFLTSMCHWLTVNVTFSTSFFWFCLMLYLQRMWTSALSTGTWDALFMVSVHFAGVFLFT